MPLHAHYRLEEPIMALLYGAKPVRYDTIRYMNVRSKADQMASVI